MKINPPEFGRVCYERAKRSPSHIPTPLPSPAPTPSPTYVPTLVPTTLPSTQNPTAVPTPVPTAEPTKIPYIKFTLSEEQCDTEIDCTVNCGRGQCDMCRGECVCPGERLEGMRCNGERILCSQLRLMASRGIWTGGWYMPDCSKFMFSVVQSTDQVIPDRRSFGRTHSQRSHHLCRATRTPKFERYQWSSPNCEGLEYGCKLSTLQ